MGNSDLGKRNFLMTKFVAFVEPPSRQNINHEPRSTKEQKKRGTHLGTSKTLIYLRTSSYSVI